jgi:perosamine synthetase
MTPLPLIPHSRPWMSEREINAAAAIVRSGRLSTGETVAKFEKAMCNTLGAKYSVAVNSGSSALHLALLALGLHKGDAVIIPDYVCTAVLNAVLMVGVVPILADTGSGSPNLSVDTVARKMNARVKAIILPHLFGIAQDLTPFRRFGVPLIEDCAQTFGLKAGAQTVGRQGDAAIFSFYATKLLCAGEGGMVLTSSKKIRDRVLDLREYDEKTEYVLRYNYKMSDLHAAVGLEQLRRFQTLLKRRCEIARAYEDALKPSRFLPFAGQRNNIYFRFILGGAPPAGDLIAFFKRQGVLARRPIYRLLSDYLGETPGPNSQWLYEHAVSIPLYPGLTQRETAAVIRGLRELARKGTGHEYSRHRLPSRRH